MTITATELIYNLGKYLRLVDTEDISIKKNGKLIAIMSNPNKDRISIMQSLKGILPNDTNENEIKSERLLKKWEYI